MPKSSLPEIPSDIVSAAEELLLLESSAQGCVIDPAEWGQISPFIDSLFPECYKLLLQRFPLAGREFDIDEEDFYQGEIYFWEPHFFRGVEDGDGVLPVAGLLLADDPELWPFCGIPDGNLLVARGRDFQSIQIYKYSAGFGIDSRSPINDSLCGFLKRLFPSDYEGGVD
ncbi:hypothetical protein [Prosthecobacter fluviatilis]|uniref:SMI1/KNR4 family protein n=1 Tax=Prosthecobacter fluviatilis TaxID=445931 RepID=A0ABW0KQR3_9BACT